MMKKRLKKLSLSRETLRSLDNSNLELAAAALAAITSPVQAPQPIITDSQSISICKYCTTPLDGCPQTQTVA
jgi:hypothetical protein